MPDPTHHDPLAHLLRDLPEETPSMTWRAGLNDRLRAETTRRIRMRRWGFGSLGLGFATAFAALAILPAMIAGPAATTPSLRISPMHSTVAADDLMALDREGSTLAEYSGVGLAARETDLTEGEVRDVLTAQML